MNQTITVIGGASKKLVKIILVPDNIAENLSVMDFLLSNGITVASSCGGVGSCGKCVINKNALSCQISLVEFLDVNPSPIVEIAYL